MKDDSIDRGAVSSLKRFARSPNLGPFLAVVFGLGGLIEAFAYASPNDRLAAMVVNLCITLPLAFAFKWPLPTAVAVTALMMIPLSGTVVITASAVIAQLTVLF